MFIIGYSELNKSSANSILLLYSVNNLPVDSVKQKFSGILLLYWEL